MHEKLSTNGRRSSMARASQLPRRLPEQQRLQNNKDSFKGVSFLAEQFNNSWVDSFKGVSSLAEQFNNSLVDSFKGVSFLAEQFDNSWAEPS